MKISDLRKEMGLTLEAFGARIGLSSKGQVSQLERANPPRCSVSVALKIEELSGGRISAADLNPDIKLVRDAERGAA